MGGGDVLPNDHLGGRRLAAFHTLGTPSFVIWGFGSTRRYSERPRPRLWAAVHVEHVPPGALPPLPQGPLPSPEGCGIPPGGGGMYPGLYWRCPIPLVVCEVPAGGRGCVQWRGPFWGGVSKL